MEGLMLDESQEKLGRKKKRKEKKNPSNSRKEALSKKASGLKDRHEVYENQQPAGSQS